MLAKLIVHAPTRIEAIDRMKRALLELRVEGVDTAVPFHLRVMDEPDFRAGNIDIKYLDTHDLLADEPSDEAIRVAALAAALLEEERRNQRNVPRVQASTAAARAGGSAWKRAGLGWRGR